MVTALSSVRLVLPGESALTDRFCFKLDDTETRNNRMNETVSVSPPRAV